MFLETTQRSKLDESSDDSFYSLPRLVTHVDEGFIQQLTDLYREHLRPGMRVFDMMSSWVSHLPDDVQFEHVEGHGMNAEELAQNPRLDHYFVQNLNQKQLLPLSDASFDAVLNTVSVQYLQYPEAVFAEIYRILKPEGIAIVSFSNRMFFQKAIQIWRDASEPKRVQLVQSYFANIPGFGAIQAIAEPSSLPSILRMMGVPGGDPFYAVLAKRVR
ncbi:class I SAM-dependent methyltransferase [Vacuolonema iberomarrocanum]|uniref:class I SAM-dependent methyltransferase n=1 Tax=Vacuolonema iberomarrocanum TaxID=3454632 RepID=UPI001A0501A5|nr:class I SAM-dependent methyltransferase [filamentous cyanobacterium LEGE 07170]